MIVKEAILEEVRDWLRTNLNEFFEPTYNCRVMKDERVPPTAGEEFVSVYGGDVLNSYPAGDPTKEIEIKFVIGITRRLSATPNEAAGDHIMTYDEDVYSRVKPSMMARANEIANMLDANYALQAAINANTVITDDSGCLVVPFGFYTMDDVPREVDEMHWDVQPQYFEQTLESVQYSGLLMEMEFQGGMYYKMVRPS